MENNNNINENDVVEQKIIEPDRVCPRCNSSDTKFCYYNNYSLSQPRYYCKGCRRYWTHGGSLRNVPIGGSSRRYKRPRPSTTVAPPPPPVPPFPPVVVPSAAAPMMTVTPPLTTATPASCYFPFGFFSSLVAMQSMNQMPAGISSVCGSSSSNFGNLFNGFEFGSRLFNEQKPFFPPVTGTSAGGGEHVAGGGSGLKIDQWPGYLSGGVCGDDN